MENLPFGDVDCGVSRAASQNRLGWLKKGVQLSDSAHCYR